MHTIHIRSLSVKCIIGIYEKERSVKQDLRINVSMECECPDAGRNDRIEDTVDYKGINKAIIALAEKSEYQLIETLAEKICEACLETNAVKRVTVTIDKPRALRYARSVAVEVSREKA